MSADEKTATLEPETLTVKVGTLEVVATGPSGRHAKVKVNGVHVPAKRLVLTVGINEVTTAELTYMPGFEFREDGSGRLWPVQTGADDPIVRDAK